MEPLGRAIIDSQKREICDRLYRLWTGSCKDLRLGQMLLNTTFGNDFYYEEDYPLIEYFEACYSAVFSGNSQG